jgi:hypothetical protein
MRLAMNHRIDQETGRVIIAAVIAWGVAVATATVEDVFGKFDAKSVAIFAVGIAFYALAVYRMDRDVHAFIQRFTRGTIVIAASLAVAALVVASLGHMPAAAVFAAPLASIAGAAAVEKLTARPTKARAKSPAATPAAT